MKTNMDEDFTQYGLIAEDVVLSENRQTVIFRSVPKHVPPKFIGCPCAKILKAQFPLYSRPVRLAFPGRTANLSIVDG